jgi:mevalonate kinase
MKTTAIQEVIETDGATRQKATDEVTSVAVRIRCKTKSKLEHLLRKANKDRLGKKVKIDDLILFALGLITETHLEDICSKTLSNKDRMELLYRKLSKEKRGITRDDFFGMLLDGKIGL